MTHEHDINTILGVNINVLYYIRQNAPSLIQTMINSIVQDLFKLIRQLEDLNIASEDQVISIAKMRFQSARDTGARCLSHLHELFLNNPTMTEKELHKALIEKMQELRDEKP